jgi:hypothetical protein
VFGSPRFAESHITTLDGSRDLDGVLRRRSMAQRLLTTGDIVLRLHGMAATLAEHEADLEPPPPGQRMKSVARRANSPASSISPSGWPSTPTTSPLTARLESRRTTDFRTSARNSGVHLTGFE